VRDRSKIQQGVVKRNLLEKAHEWVRLAVSLGDVAVDATMGNGYDTLFLAQCVGHTGRVVGFDVLQDAVDATQKRLGDAGVEESRCDLYLASHDRMAELISGEVSAVMFNLGYFPGGNKALVTKTESTLLALDQSIRLLRERGVLSVMCYPGHAGGDTEAKAVEAWISDLVAKNSRVLAKVTHWRRENAQEGTPFLFVVEKGISA